MLAELFALTLITQSMKGAAPVNMDASMMQNCTNSTETPASCINEISRMCEEESDDGYTTRGMIACAGRETAVWDARLNAAYTSLREMMQRNGRQDQMDAIQQVQRLWIQYRDAECAQRSLAYEGGTMSGITHAYCINQVTAVRALDLEDQLMNSSL
jgi:uncharacterized protein YecT (DUF1311 family)